MATKRITCAELNPWNTMYPEMFQRGMHREFVCFLFDGQLIVNTVKGNLPLNKHNVLWCTFQIFTIF